jgi:hypothetical protein
MKKVWLIFFYLVSNSLFCHIYLNSDAARVGVANLNLISSSPLTDYYQAAVSNPGLSTSISHPFQFSGIENGNISFSYKYKNFHLSAGSLYLISNHYNLYSNYLGFNYLIKDLLTLGISQKFISVFEEENYFYPVTDLGCKIAHAKTMLAINYTNILHKQNCRIDLPNIISTEISYNPLHDTFIALGLEKEKNHKLQTKFGIRYNLLESLTLLTGYSLNPNQISFGLGIDYRKMSINYAIITHPELDSTHHISLIYAL